MRRLAFALLLLATATLLGCGDKTKSKTEKSKTPKSSDTNGQAKKEAKKTAKTVAKKVALKDKAVGKWKSEIELDDENLKQMLVADKVPADKMDEELKLMKSQLSGMAIEVDMKADGTYTLTMSGAGPTPEEKKGKWEFVSDEGDVLKLKTKDDGDEKWDTITLTFKGDDEYAYETDDPEFKQAPIKVPVTFKRVKE